jgi:hypothetical protein
MVFLRIYFYTSRLPHIINVLELLTAGLLSHNGRPVRSSISAFSVLLGLRWDIPLIMISVEIISSHTRTLLTEAKRQASSFYTIF